MQYSPLQAIKERLTIEDVVSSYVKLERSGVNFRARCPFHNEKTPSFFVSPTRGSYYCFGCGASGDIFSFVENFEGLDFKGALKLLAQRAGVELKYERREESDEKEKLFLVMEEATKYFEKNLSDYKDAQEYLFTRGLNEKTIKDFRIGFAKDEWRDLHDALLKKGFSTKILESAGLVKQGEVKNANQQSSYYDRFRGRIIFPIADSSGRVIAFSGRIFEKALKKPSENLAKYLNSPETPIFTKSQVLYGIEKAKESIRKNNFSILVEGQMDLIMSHQAGFKNTVASSGTALSDNLEGRENAISNLGLVRRLSNNIVLGYDADKAGLSASERTAKIALSLGMDVKVANLPEGKDPADLILQNGPDAWKEAIRGSKHVVLFLTEKFVSANRNDERKALRMVREKVLPFLIEISSAIERAFFVKKISEIAMVPESAILADLKDMSKNMNQNTIDQTYAKGAVLGTLLRKEQILRKVLSILLWVEGLDKKPIDIEKMKGRTEEILHTPIDEILDTKIGNNKEKAIFEAEKDYQTDEHLKNDVDELLDNLEIEVLKEEYDKKLKDLKITEQDKKDTTDILKELQIINNKIQELKNGQKK